MNKKLIYSLTTVLLLSTAQLSHARGFISGLIDDACGGCGVGEVLDDWNESSGHIAEHWASTAADMVYPGAGTALDLYWEHQRRDGQAWPGANSGNQGGWTSSPAGYPNQSGYPNQGMQYGNFCITPIGVFGPGQPLPLGSICNAQGYNGYIGR